MYDKDKVTMCDIGNVILYYIGYVTDCIQRIEGIVNVQTVYDECNLTVYDKGNKELAWK